MCILMLNFFGNEIQTAFSRLVCVVHAIFRNAILLKYLSIQKSLGGVTVILITLKYSKLTD